MATVIFIHFHNGMGVDGREGKGDEVTSGFPLTWDSYG